MSEDVLCGLFSYLNYSIYYPTRTFNASNYQARKSFSQRSDYFFSTLSHIALHQNLGGREETTIISLKGPRAEALVRDVGDTAETSGPVALAEADKMRLGAISICFLQRPSKNDLVRKERYLLM